MLQTLLTVLLLATGFLAGLLSRSVRRVAVPLAGLTAAVMVVNFITARVAEAGARVASRRTWSAKPRLRPSGPQTEYEDPPAMPAVRRVSLRGAAGWRGACEQGVRCPR
jgi:hypothetical protein